MSRESRKLLEGLETLAKQNNITTLVTSKEVYIADQITLVYYTAPILNLIKSKINQMKKKSSKHFTVEHWVSVLNSIFGNNSSVKREVQSDVAQADDVGCHSHSLISKYLLVDYSSIDSELIYNIVHKYSDNSIQKAIQTATNANVYNIQYVNAILEKEQAVSNMHKQKMDKLREKANSSNSVLNRPRVEHTALDMAMNQYNWEQQKQNAELEKKMMDMFGGDFGGRQ